MIRAIVLVLGLVLPAVGAAGEPPMVRVALDRDEVIPGQPIALEVTVLVSTWMVEPPVFPGFELPNLIVRLPERATLSVSERIRGRTWAGVSRTYRLYPMTGGRYRLPPQRLVITYADPDTNKPVTAELVTDELVFAGAVPAAARDLDPFIAAESITLEQTTSDAVEALEPGAAVTRSVVARIEGASPIFLPPLLEPFEAAGLSAYPREPLVEETADRGVLSGSRTEEVTYMAAAGGDYAAPAIRLRWYNLSSGRVEIAEVPGFAFTVTGSPAAAGSGGLSPRSLGVAAVLLIAAAAASWFAFRLAPVVRAYRRRRHEAWLRSEPCAFGNLAAAVRARDYGGTIAALDVWTRRLPAAADREDKALAAALRTLGRNIYGSAPVAPTQAEWSAVAVALAAARRSRNARRLEARSAAMLPPLNPGHTA